MKKIRIIKWIEKIIYLITRFVLFMGVYIVIFFLFSKHDEESEKFGNKTPREF